MVVTEDKSSQLSLGSLQGSCKLQDTQERVEYTVMAKVAASKQFHLCKSLLILPTNVQSRQAGITVLSRLPV